MRGIEALWSVEFATNLGFSSVGIIACEGSRVFGGDAAYVYVGRYELADGLVRIDLRVSRYNTVGNVQLPLNLDRFDLALWGPFRPERFIVKGTVVGMPDLTLEAICTRRAELP